MNLLKPVDFQTISGKGVTGTVDGHAVAMESAGITLVKGDLTGILYPFRGLLLSPMIAAAAMSFSSVSVIANALRLRSTRI